MSTLHKISGCDDPARKADVVFVHGLGGDAFGTWRHGEDESTSWPHWLGKDFPNVGIWSLGYAAAKSKWSKFPWFGKSDSSAGQEMSLPARATEVLNRMAQHDIGARPVFFIGHSLGGLVAKQILRSSSDSFDPRSKRVVENTRAVLFLATPHGGAPWASFAKSMSAVFGPTITLEGLGANDEHLEELNNWYRNHSVKRGIHTTTYRESLPFKNLSLIVNSTSAHPGCGENPIPHETDHIAIAKPRLKADPVCISARLILNDHVLSTRSASPAAEQSLQPPAHRIPHELPPLPETFFGRTKELHDLIARLQAAKNTAVVGPAGLGKTALAAKALATVLEQANPFPGGILYIDLYLLRKTESAWNAIADKLEGPAFMDRSLPRDRATQACHARRILLIIEGGEEAEGQPGHDHVGTPQLLDVLASENRWLLLTRLSTQVEPSKSIKLEDALDPQDAADLFDSLTGSSLAPELRSQALQLLQGHPLALTWAGNLLARGDEDPNHLLGDWTQAGLPNLSDPTNAPHTLHWLFERSVRHLSVEAKDTLQALGLLANIPAPLAAVEAIIQKGARPAITSLVQCGLLRRSTEPDHWQFTHVLGYLFARKELDSNPAIRQALGQWLNETLAAALAPNAAPPSNIALPFALEHLAALLRTDQDQSLWRLLASAALYTHSTRLTQLGSLPRVRQTLDAVAGWFTLFNPQQAQQPEWLRERSALLNFQGNILSAQGDLPAALDFFNQSLGIARALALSDPSNAEAQRDLFAILSNVGGILSDQGDLPAALAAFNESLDLARTLALSYPSSAQARRDLSLSLIKVGGILSDQGDLPAAIASFNESLILRRTLAIADPFSALAQRDLSVSLNNVGNVLSAQHDLPAALSCFNESLVIAGALALADPSNAPAQRDLLVSLDKVGNVLSAQHDLPAALDSFNRSLVIARTLALSAPSNAQAQRDLSVSLNKVATLKERQNDPASALSLANESLTIIEPLAAIDSTNATWQNDLAITRALVARLRL